MIYACWSLKGGSGTTSFAAGMALCWSREEGREVLLVDLAGDCASALGLASHNLVGIGDWLSTEKEPAPQALIQLEHKISSHLFLLSRGRTVGPLQAQRISNFIQHLSGLDRDIILDCGNLWDLAFGIHNQGESDALDTSFRRQVVEAADHSWIFTRACYLALRRVSAFPIRPTGVALLQEPNRALDSLDVSEIIKAPVVLKTASDPSVARAIDMGLLETRLPRRLERALCELRESTSSKGEVPDTRA